MASAESNKVVEVPDIVICILISPALHYRV